MRTFLSSSTLAVVIAGTLAATPAPASEAAVWNVDQNHTEVNFSVKHFFTPVSGSFQDFDIALEYDPENPETSSVDVTIQVNSINTRNERRDNHLRSGDFFAAEENPTITFRSTAVRTDGPDRLLVTGPLTMKGVTREIELPVTILGVHELSPEMAEAMGVSSVASFQAEMTIDRRDFEVGVGNWAATAVVGSDVDISINVEANR